MSEETVKIELHTIATYDGKEYELEELMNGMFEKNTELHNQLSQKENILKKVEKYLRSNEWAIDYEHSNCRTHLLEMLKEV